jgi:cation transporter-like permease
MSEPSKEAGVKESGDTKSIVPGLEFHQLTEEKPTAQTPSGMRIPSIKLGKKYSSVSPEQEQVESVKLMNSTSGAIELREFHDGSGAEVEEDEKTEDDTPCELEEEAPMTLEEALRELSVARAQIVKLQKQNKAQKHKISGAMYNADIDDIHYRETGIGSLDDYLKTSVFRLLMQRLPWLLVLLVLQSCSALILHSANRMIEHNLVIAYFVPMVVGTGGNAGNQPGVMVTRALSTYRSTDAPFPIWRLLFKEIGLGFISALCVALTAFLRVLVEFPSEVTGAVAIALAMFMVVVIAIGLGILFSWGLERCSCDPAAGSAPLLTTVSDLLGIGILTGLAYAILG